MSWLGREGKRGNVIESRRRDASDDEKFSVEVDWGLRWKLSSSPTVENREVALSLTDQARSGAWCGVANFNSSIIELD